MIARIVTAGVIVAGMSVAANADAPIADITGKWSGEGFVQKDENARKMNVRCEIDGEQSDTTVAFEGMCRAMLVMKREIGAKLVRDGSTYTGTYKGSAAGIAQLEGGQDASGALDLTMTFPKEVNGDDQARMTIDVKSDDMFTITTADMMESGVEVTTSSIEFHREDDVAAR